MSESMKSLGECLVNVRWCDLDNYGHVNNSRYFEYMTEGRARILKDLISPYDTVQYLLVDTACNFQKPIIYPCDLKIVHSLQAIGRTSFTIACDMRSVDGETLYAQGTAKLVCYDPIAKKPVAIPAVLMAVFS